MSKGHSGHVCEDVKSFIHNNMMILLKKLIKVEFFLHTLTVTAKNFRMRLISDKNMSENKTVLKF